MISDCLTSYNVPLNRASYKLLIQLVHVLQKMNKNIGKSYNATFSCFWGAKDGILQKNYLNKNAVLFLQQMKNAVNSSEKK